MAYRVKRQPIRSVPLGTVVSGAAFQGRLIGWSEMQICIHELHYCGRGLVKNCYVAGIKMPNKKINRMFALLAS